VTKIFYLTYSYRHGTIVRFTSRDSEKLILFFKLVSVRVCACVHKHWFRRYALHVRSAESAESRSCRYKTRQVCSWVEFVDGCDAIHQAEMRADLSSQARTLDINVHHLRGNAITADPLSDSNEILCR